MLVAITPSSVVVSQSARPVPAGPTRVRPSPPPCRAVPHRAALHSKGDDSQGRAWPRLELAGLSGLPSDTCKHAVKLRALTGNAGGGKEEGGPRERGTDRTLERILPRV